MQAADLQQRFGITTHVIACDLESARRRYTAPRRDQKPRHHAQRARQQRRLRHLRRIQRYVARFATRNGATQLDDGGRTHEIIPPRPAATKGKILNLASTAAFQPGPYMAVYYATKAFVLSFSEALAAELAEQRRHGNRVLSRSDGLRLPRQSRHARFENGQRQATSHLGGNCPQRLPRDAAREKSLRPGNQELDPRPIAQIRATPPGYPHRHLGDRADLSAIP